MWRVGILLTALAAAPVAAAPHRERAAVAAIDASEKIPEHQVAKAKQVIEQGLAAAGYTIVASAPLVGPQAACRHGDCVRDVAQAAGVDAVVFAVIASKDESAIVDLVLFDGMTAQQIASVHEVCDLCGEAELDERLGVAASALRAQAVDVVARQARLDAALRAHPAPSLVPGATLGVAGLAAIGVGAYLWSIDGRGTCHAGDGPVYPAAGAVIRYPDPNDPSVFVCRDRYATRTAGIATLGAGAVAAAVGLTWVVRARRYQPVLDVGPQGAQLALAVAW